MRRLAALLLPAALGGCFSFTRTDVSTLRYEVQVRDEKGRPVEGAEVVLRSYTTEVRRTDDDGRTTFRLERRVQVNELETLGALFWPPSRRGESSGPPQRPLGPVLMIRAPGHAVYFGRVPHESFIRRNGHAEKAEAVVVRTPASGETRGPQLLREVAAAAALQGHGVGYRSVEVSRLSDHEVHPLDPVIARADAEGPSPVPVDGFLLRSIGRDRQGRPISKDRSATFGFCAYPADGRTRARTYILDEEGVVYAKDTGGRPVERFPGNPVDEGWTPVAQRSALPPGE